MNIDEEIRLMREKTERLLALLKDAEPGLATWRTAVGRSLDAIAAHAPSYVEKGR